MYAPTNHRHGFSLIEGLVAITIMSVALLTIISAVPLTLQTNKQAELESLASVYARAKLEALLITPYDDISTGTIEPRAAISSDPTNPASKLQRTSTVTLIDSNFNATATDSGLKKIVVTVDWPNPKGGLGSVTLTSLLSQK